MDAILVLVIILSGLMGLGAAANSFGSDSRWRDADDTNSGEIASIDD